MQSCVELTKDSMRITAAAMNPKVAQLNSSCHLFRNLKLGECTHNPMGGLSLCVHAIRDSLVNHLKTVERSSITDVS
jgi:hypothetical protein